MFARDTLARYLDEVNVPYEPFTDFDALAAALDAEVTNAVRRSLRDDLNVQLAVGQHTMIGLRLYSYCSEPLARQCVSVAKVTLLFQGRLHCTAHHE